MIAIDYSSRVGFFTARTLAPFEAGRSSPTGVGKVSEVIRAVVRESGMGTEVMYKAGRLEVHSPSAPSEGAWTTTRPGLPSFRKSILDAQYIAHLDVPRAAVLVHDLFRVRNPAGVSRMRVGPSAMMRALQRAPLLLVPSEYTRAEACELLRVPPERTLLTPYACNRDVFRPLGVDRRILLESLGLPADRPLILHVSYNYPRKNVERIFGAVSLLAERMPEAVFAKIGEGPGEEGFLAKHPGLHGRVFVLGRIPESDLAALYNAADCFVFPSLAEGFGLPALEAQACGCPVVTSNTTALAEIAGPLCLTVDPLDTDAIADAMEKILETPEFRTRQAAANAAWMDRFSWEPLRRAVREWIA